MLPSPFNHHRFYYLASYNDEITTFSFWKMSSLGGSFLQVTNNQTKNNGGAGGAPSSPRAKGIAVTLHVKFSKCRSAPIMQRFPLSSLICIQICRAEERRPSKFVLWTASPSPSLPLLLSVCGFKVRHFHLNWRELGSVAARCMDQRQLLPKIYSFWLPNQMKE